MGRGLMLAAVAATVAVALTACGSSGNSTTSSSSSASTSASQPAASNATTSAYAAPSSSDQTAATATTTSFPAGVDGKIDELCTATSQAISMLTAPNFPPSAVTASTLPAVAKYIADVVPLQQLELRELRAAVAQKPSARLVALAQALSTALGSETLGLNAAKGGLVADFKKHYAAYLTQSNNFEALARAAGLKDC